MLVLKVTYVNVLYKTLQYLLHKSGGIIRRRYDDHGLVAGTVTVATFGSPNTTPCDIAAAGTTNLTINCKSVFPTFSGNNIIGTRVLTLILVKNHAFLMRESKNVFTVY